VHFTASTVDLFVGVAINIQMNWVLTMKSKTAMILIAAVAIMTLRRTGEAQESYAPEALKATQQQGDPQIPAAYRSFIDDDEESTTYSSPREGYVSYLQDEETTPFADDPVGTGSVEEGLEPEPMEEDSPSASYEPAGYFDEPAYVPCTMPLLCNSWFGLEYMNAYTKGRNLPPLLTTSPPGVDGILPGSEMLFGAEDVGDGRQSAGRLNFGTWIDPDCYMGLGGRFTIIEGDSSSYYAASDGNGTPLLARPFYNTNPIPGITGPDSLIITDTGVRSGTVDIVANNELLMAEAYLRHYWFGRGNRRVELLGGYHFVRLDDSLAINHQMTQIMANPGIPAGTQFDFSDIFDATNEFHGGSIGVLGEFNRGPLTLSIMTKVSLGNMRQRVNIMGSSSAAGTSYDGGLLALPTNMGVLETDVFGVIPEADVKLIWHASKRLDLTLGYSFVYWNSVALAGDQIQVGTDGVPVVNNSQVLGGSLIGPANPVLPEINDASFWLQGITVGFTINL